MRQSTVRRSAVGRLLDAELRIPRVRSLEAACAELAARPLDVTLAEIRQALEGQVGGEGRRRLHVLVSTLYHRAGASLDLTIALRTEIEAAPAAPPTEE
ncbi:hypothetical protein OG896_28100 [Streptomyces sp. NBC_00669]|uniref:hypothetical protein n=1 Tax=Streptomyces sp. NBC_00669 TaxID=2976011 RepID=UPI002E373219|nr:hypothetical protein [Streptomyces sp. NBC_00669]